MGDGCQKGDAGVRVLLLGSTEYIAHKQCQLLQEQEDAAAKKT